ncbi:MAG: YciI family protein [Myxococcota bacterium]
MKYAILVYETDAALDNRHSPEYWGAYRAYGALLGERITKGAALEGIDTATTIRLRDGEQLVEDGPFADTKERLGGFYVVEARDLDEALEMAAQCPSVKEGAVEVRPLMEMPS